MTNMLVDLSPALPFVLPIPPTAPEPVEVERLPDPRPDNPAEALSWLGGTVEEVAEGLRARGIKGEVESSVACPLANYLEEWWDDIWVTEEEAGRGFRLKNTVPLPDPCYDFVMQFDSGAFPDLIAD